MPASEPTALPLPFSRCLHSATKLLQPTGVSSLQTRATLLLASAQPVSPSPTWSLPPCHPVILIAYDSSPLPSSIGASWAADL